MPGQVQAPTFDRRPPEEERIIIIGGNTIKAIGDSFYPESHILGALADPPVSKIYVGIRTITGYSSSLDECDDTPYVTASGEVVREGIVASNEFPFGTRLEIEGEVYEVQDRMHRRFQSGEIDIWFPMKKEAKDFGKQLKEVYLIK